MIQSSQLKNLLLGFLVLSPIIFNGCSSNFVSVPPEYIKNDVLSFNNNFIVKSKESSKISDNTEKEVIIEQIKSINSTNNIVSPKNDVPFDQYSWNLKNINADKKIYNLPESDLTIAVIDTGVDINHPALKNRLLPLIDLWKEYEGDDVLDYNNQQYYYNGKDGNGHGTHVTGIIGKIFDSVGASGIQILPIKVANYTGRTTPSLLARGIIVAVDNGAKVINLSLGGQISEGSQKIEEAVNYAHNKGVVIVSSTGNESTRKFEFIKKVNVPSSFNNVISVASINSHDKVSDFSNGGPEVDISAPGGEDDKDKIYSSWPTYKTYESFLTKTNDSFAFLSGTSIACPHVSSTAILILAENPEFTPDNVRERLIKTATDINEKGFDFATGYGKLDLNKALTTH